MILNKVNQIGFTKPLISSLILGSACTIGSQSIIADEKDTNTEPLKTLTDKTSKIPSQKNITKDQLQTSKDEILEELFKKVETLKPDTKERKEVLTFLKQTAISQAKSDNKNEITKRLINIMDRNREPGNWSEISSTLIDIINGQASGNYGIKIYPFNETLKELKPHFEQLFKNSILRLSTDDPEKQMIETDNLNILQQQFSSTAFHYTILDTRKSCGEFFNNLKRLEKFTDETKSTEALIKGCFVLLEFSRNERENHKAFIEWLNTQTKKSINNKSSKEKQKVLESAMREELYNVAKTFNHLELSKSLVIPYTKLIRENNSNIAFLKNALRSYNQFKAYENKEINDNAIGLFDSVVDGLPKLSTNEQKELKAQILLLPQNGNFESDNEAEQARFVERLSKIFCTNKDVDPDGFMQLTDSFLHTPQDFYRTPLATRWHPYTLYKLINDNKEYFEKNINHITEAAKNSKNEKIKTQDMLLETYRTFQHIPRMKELCGTYIFLDPKRVNPDHIDEFKKEVTNWYQDKLERPMFKSILHLLENETTKTAATSKGVRYTEKESWAKLNKHLEKIVLSNPILKEEFRDLLINRLENEKNPSNREMIYKTIHDVVYNSSWLEDEKQKLPSLLKKGIREESAYGASLIGEVISKGWHYHSFIKTLDDYQTIESLKQNELSPLDQIKFDLVGIANGKSELMKAYLPDCSFKVGKDGRINQDDLNALIKLRENAFLAISSTSLNSGSLKRDYDTVINFLEKRFERIGNSETLPKTWGKQTASLINLYLKASAHENEIFLNSKLSFLRGKFFDGIEKIYEIEGEKKAYTSIAFFNMVLESEFIRLNPSENRKIIDELYKHKQSNEQVRERIFREAPRLLGKYTEMRREFALNVLKLLCEYNHEKFNEYVTYLQQLGFNNNELRNVLEVFLARD